jgi:BirA family biotin operon repressor/biotin-[acetyl-CoA-carboxylase] ligase
LSSDPLWLKMVDSGVLAGNPVLLLAETGSTNEVAIGLADGGAVAYSLVVAESQTAGRGRLGRSWQSPSGSGLYFSMILRPRLEPEDLPKITLAAGLAVCSAIEKVSGLSLLIKWPNDILLDGRKLGGILSEVADLQNESGRPAVVLGVGLNINTPRSAFPADLQDKAAYLSVYAGREYPRGEILAAIVVEIKKIVERFEREGFVMILEEWRRRDASLGRELSWLTQGGDIVKGVSLGPDRSGQLLIRDDQGTVHEVLSGDISLARADD